MRVSSLCEFAKLTAKLQVCGFESRLEPIPSSRLLWVNKTPCLFSSRSPPTTTPMPRRRGPAHARSRHAAKHPTQPAAAAAVGSPNSAREPKAAFNFTQARPPAISLAKRLKNVQGMTLLFQLNTGSPLVTQPAAAAAAAAAVAGLFPVSRRRGLGLFPVALRFTRGAGAADTWRARAIVQRKIGLGPRESNIQQLFALFVLDRRGISLLFSSSSLLSPSTYGYEPGIGWCFCEPQRDMFMVVFITFLKKNHLSLHHQPHQQLWELLIQV